MSSPILPAKDLDAQLMYAPLSAREKPPVVPVAADEPPIEQPPQSHSIDALGPTFSEDLAVRSCDVGFRSILEVQVQRSGGDP